MGRSRLRARDGHVERWRRFTKSTRLQVARLRSSIEENRSRNSGQVEAARTDPRSRIKETEGAAPVAPLSCAENQSSIPIRNFGCVKAMQNERHHPLQ